ncbi:hypothetical protein CANARDRAFT_29300, partial [[Candida] arabinofermentans NRRL YB-2248]
MEANRPHYRTSVSGQSSPIAFAFEKDIEKLSNSNTSSSPIPFSRSFSVDYTNEKSRSFIKLDEDEEEETPTNWFNRLFKKTYGVEKYQYKIYLLIQYTLLFLCIFTGFIIILNHKQLHKFNNKSIISTNENDTTLNNTEIISDLPTTSNQVEEIIVDPELIQAKLSLILNDANDYLRNYNTNSKQQAINDDDDDDFSSELNEIISLSNWILIIDDDDNQDKYKSIINQLLEKPIIINFKDYSDNVNFVKYLKNKYMIDSFPILLKNGDVVNLNDLLI